MLETIEAVAAGVVNGLAIVAGDLVAFAFANFLVFGVVVGLIWIAVVALQWLSRVTARPSAAEKKPEKEWY